VRQSTSEKVPLGMSSRRQQGMRSEDQVSPLCCACHCFKGVKASSLHPISSASHHGSLFLPGRPQQGCCKVHPNNKVSKFGDTRSGWGPEVLLVGNFGTCLFSQPDVYVQGVAVLCCGYVRLCSANCHSCCCSNIMSHAAR
jgi:hypothetical protein